MRYATGIPIGRGGMGEIFKVFDSTLQRHVALKILRRGDEESVRRMLLEAQAQARVDHPNVCRVYDVGEIDGRAYISMQLIEGRPLDEIAPGITLEQRVALLETVCHAVQAAHAAGLIHRDLKPGNIMVERRDDGSLVPYVVDFGVARHHATSGLTVTGQVLGTPAYMSPEQARGEVRDLDRRSDVYGLGAVMYHLLTGRPPFGVEGGAQALVDVLQRDPVPPRKLAPAVPPDLETICLTCLEKEPARRYPSARALADDLRRYLNGDPIAARPASVVSRTLRRARRHPAVAALVLLLFVGLPAAAAKYTLDLRRERSVAVAARADAEGLMDFMLEDVFAGLEPLGRLDLLERVAARSLEYYRALAAESLEPDAGARRARAFRNVGKVLEAQGQRNASLPAYEEYHALALALAERDPANPALRQGVAQSLRLIAEVLEEQGRFREAGLQFARSVAEAREALALAPGDPPALRQLWRSLTAAAANSREQRDHAAADAALQEALALAERRAAADPPDPDAAHDRALTHSALGLLRRDQARYDDAVAEFERALGLNRGLLERDPRNAAWQFQVQLDLNHLANAHIYRKDLTAALAMYDESIAIGRRLTAQDPANAKWARELAFAHADAAYILRRTGQLRRALAELEASMAISRQLAARDPSNLSAANDLAWDLLEVGRILEALGETGRATAMWQEGVRTVAPVTASTSQLYYANTHAQLLLQLGRVEDAGPLLQRLQDGGFEDPALDELRERLTPVAASRR